MIVFLSHFFEEEAGMVLLDWAIYAVAIFLVGATVSLSIDRMKLQTVDYRVFQSKELFRGADLAKDPQASDDAFRVIKQ